MRIWFEIFGQQGAFNSNNTTTENNDGEKSAEMVFSENSFSIKKPGMDILKHKNDDLTHCNKKLEEQLNVYKNMLDELQTKEVEPLKQTNAKLAQEIQSLKVSSEESRGNVDRLKKLGKSLLDQKSDLMKSLDLKENDSQNLKRSLSTKDIEIKETLKENGNLKKQVENLQKDLDKAKSIPPPEKANAELAQESQSLKASYDKSQGDVARLKRQCKSLLDEKSDLRKRLDLKENYLENLKRSLTANENEMKEKHKESENLTKRVENLQKDLDEANDNLPSEDLYQKIDELNENYQVKVGNLESTIKRLNTAVQEKDDLCSKLNQKLNDREAIESENLQGHLVAKIKKLVTEKKVLEDNHSKLVTAYRDAKNRVCHYEEEFSKKETSEDMKNKLQQCQLMVAQLEKENTTLKKRVESDISKFLQTDEYGMLKKAQQAHKLDIAQMKLSFEQNEKTLQKLLKDSASKYDEQILELNQCIKGKEVMIKKLDQSLDDAYGKIYCLKEEKSKVEKEDAKKNNLLLLEKALKARDLENFEKLVINLQEKEAEVASLNDCVKTLENDKSIIEKVIKGNEIEKMNSKQLRKQLDDELVSIKYENEKLKTENISSDNKLSELVSEREKNIQEQQSQKLTKLQGKKDEWLKCKKDLESLKQSCIQTNDILLKKEARLKEIVENVAKHNAEMNETKGRYGNEFQKLKQRIKDLTKKNEQLHIEKSKILEALDDNKNPLNPMEQNPNFDKKVADLDSEVMDLKTKLDAKIKDNTKVVLQLVDVQKKANQVSAMELKVQKLKIMIEQKNNKIESMELSSRKSIDSLRK